MRIFVSTVAILLAVAGLSACGLGDTAATAAAVGSAKAQEAQEAKKTQERFETKLDAALQAGQQRLQEGDAAAR